jgi:hypothetical protein
VRLHAWFASKNAIFYGNSEMPLGAAKIAYTLELIGLERMMVCMQQMYRHLRGIFKRKVEKNFSHIAHKKISPSENPIKIRPCKK